MHGPEDQWPMESRVDDERRAASAERRRQRAARAAGSAPAAERPARSSQLPAQRVSGAARVGAPRVGAGVGAPAGASPVGRASASVGGHVRTGANGRPAGGDAAGVSGQVYGGRAPAASAALAPAVPKGRKRRRTPLWAILVTTLGAMLMLLSGGLITAYNAAVDRYAGNVNTDGDLLGGAQAQAAAGEELDGPINMLLLGVDARKSNPDDVRSDTIIVLHVPSSHDQAYLISVPRDSWVTIPGIGERKITEAFYHGYQNGGDWEGGFQLVAQTIHELTGLTFTAGGIIDFSGFKKIIDEVGGLEFCVDTAAYSEHLVLVDGEPMGIRKAQRNGYQYQRVEYEEGCQTLAGWQALDYARQRKTLASGEGDYGRQRHQKQLLQAMAEKVTSGDVLTDLGKIDGLLLAAGDAVQLDIPDNVDLIDFLFTFKDIRPGDLISLQTNGGEYHSDTRNGQSVELLSEESLDMFRAAANDTMAQFVLNHANFVSPD